MLHNTISKSFFVFASLSVMAAMYGWSVQDFWLASTQWMQVSVVFLLMAIYVKICESDDLKIIDKRKKGKKKKK